MSGLAEQLDGIRVRASTSGGDIRAELSNRREVSISFEEGVYGFISETALEAALSRLARQLYTGWVRQYRDAISTTYLTPRPQEQGGLGFQEEVRSIEVSVESADGRVSLSTVGMQDFSARVRRGTVRELGEEEFAARIAEVAPQLVRRYQARVLEMKVRG